MKVNSISILMHKAVSIASFIRSSIAFRAALCEYMQVKSVSMWLPTATRWYSIVTMIRQLLQLKEAMQVSISSHIQS